ncbi:MAG TPA: TIM barrel protein [Thermoanaerobaculia bacterium]|jgi:hypothetical protein|nr:TIM barrel protein [Thermoanaerobaculia bacterium]
MQRSLGTTAIELSALRDSELPLLLASLGDLDLGAFAHVSLHAPSALSRMSEQELISALVDVPAAWPIIVHPDVITTPERWRFLGARLCLENMDQRKATGRTLPEMEAVFQELPDASFCFDIGHARQVDTTMAVAVSLLRRFRQRLRQVHLSEVDPYGKHIPIGFTALCGFRRIAKLLPEDCPVIIESMVTADQARHELEVAVLSLSEEDDSQDFPRTGQAQMGSW